MGLGFELYVECAIEKPRTCVVESRVTRALHSAGRALSNCPITVDLFYRYDCYSFFVDITTGLVGDCGSIKLEMVVVCTGSIYFMVNVLF